MSMSFALNVPTDIPWRRICVSEDMLDQKACDPHLTPRWKTSIAVYRYDPADEYQPHEDLRVSYLKVAVTIVPYAPELGVDLLKQYVPPTLVDDLQEAFPCYGALLHVTVTPKGDAPLARYPYIADCEPKKREVYEMVTDTGEVLSGSSTNVAVGKSAVSTNSTENYNIDTGWNFSQQFQYAGTGGGHSLGATGEWGSANKTGLENTNLRTTETSAERRELQSHVTQLAQMYNLFQAFHIGTNRAMFFLEPRPHIRQSETTFINGPRALEGLQEVFLTIVSPKGVDFCSGVVLETAHLTKTPTYRTEIKEELFTDFRLTATAQNKDDDWSQNDHTSEPVPLTRDYHAPPGWEIVNYAIVILPESKRIHSGPTVTFTPSTLSVSGAVTWRFWEGGWGFPEGYTDNYENGVLNVDVIVKLQKTERTLEEYVRSLFLSARQLCCCDKLPGPKYNDSITYEKSVKGIGRIGVSAGQANRETFSQSRLLTDYVKREMVRSGTSARRVPLGQMKYEQSDVFFTRVADILRAHRLTREFEKPISKSTIVPKKLIKDVQHTLGKHISLAQILTADAETLGASLGMALGDARKTKREILAAINAKAAQRQGMDDKPGSDGGDQTHLPSKHRK